MSVLWLELPRVLVRPFHIVDADAVQNFLQVTLRKGKEHLWGIEFHDLVRCSSVLTQSNL